MRQIYFDNAATSFPKPPSVAEAVKNAVINLGGNPGRGGHVFSQTAAKAVYDTRAECARLFGAEPENVVFTQNCTHAINLALKGIARPGDRILISSMEHNSVARPTFALTKKGVRADVAEVGKNDAETLENLRGMMKSDVRCVVFTAASNVTGRLMPIREIASLCRERGVCLIVDGAQAAGTVPLGLGLGMNFICVPGHKGLCGPAGTGLLISDGEYSLSTVIEGGTGATSGELEQTGFMPERLESGTLNTVGIAGLGAGIRYLNRVGINTVFAHETALCDMLIAGLRKIGARVYRTGDRFVPIVSFNIGDIPAPALASRLSEGGFALRGGLHCALLAHKTLGTLPDGTVRFSPSVFSSERDVAALINYLKKISETGFLPIEI